jgi:hypothetical protein
MARIKKSQSIWSITIENIPYKDITIARKKTSYSIDKNKEIITLSRLKRTGQLTIEQYEELFWEKPYLSQNIKYYKVVKVSSWLRMRFDNFDKFKNWYYIYHHKNYKSVKHYHNYTNIDNIIKFKKLKDINIVNIHFDDESIHRYDNLNLNQLIKADWVMTKWDNYYFIETDMWTENYETLKEKDYNYFKLIINLKEKDNFKNYKVVLFTSKIRMLNLKNNNVFENLDKYNLIEYYPN